MVQPGRVGSIGPVETWSGMEHGRHVHRPCPAPVHGEFGFIAPRCRLNQRRSVMAKIAKRRGRLVLDFYDATGKRTWKTLPAGTTLTRAKEMLRDIEDRLMKGTYLPEKRTPTFDEVAADWIKHKSQNVRTSTLACYEGHLRKHLRDVGHLRINRITVATVEKFIAARRAAGVTVATMKKIIVTFGQVLGYAVRHRLIDYNPVRDAEKPRDQGLGKSR